MTLRKKLLILNACLLVILCVMVTGTIAWLTDNTQKITNTFTPSDITVKLVETDATDSGSDSDDLVDSWAKMMVPGTALAKDPTVKVTADIPCYVFIKVEKSANLDTYIAYEIDDEWIALDVDGNEQTDDGVYYRVIEASADEQSFNILVGSSFENHTWNTDHVYVKHTVTKAMMNALKEENATWPTLTFTAYACQKAGFENNIIGAWNEASGVTT